MMKKLFVLAFAVTCIMSMHAQVFNTATTLKKQTLSLGIEPVIVAEGNNDLRLFGHIGYGLKKGIDLSAKVGFLNGYKYLGADVEFALGKHFSASGGIHSASDFGLDGTFLGTINPAKNVAIYSGIDADIQFADELQIPIWIPIGVEVFIKKKVAFILEGSIGVYDNAWNMIGGGINYYF